MPLTLSHPAAIIPLHKLLGRRASISAMAIGSMSPDFVYFLPSIPVSGVLSHSLLGILLFCLPSSLLAYAIFHLLLKRPVTTLLPARIAYRLSQSVFDTPLLPPHPIPVLALSIILGACTHIGWDAFTHGNSAIVQKFDLFRMVVLSVGGHTLTLFKLLQHLSTLTGLAALAWWIAAWAKARPVSGDGVGAPCLALRLRIWIIGGMVSVSLGSAAVIFGRWFGTLASGGSIEQSIFHAVVAAINGGVLSVTVFSLIWHAYLFHRPGK